MGFRRILGRFGGDERGAIAIWAAVSMPMILGIGALAFDMNNMYTTKAQLQHTADAAAMAAVRALPDTAAAVTAAQNYGEMNMPSADHGGVISTSDVEPGNWDSAGRVFTPAGTPLNAVRVAARRSAQNSNPMPTSIAAALGITSVDISASSVVAMGGPSTGGNACIISLNKTASQAFYLQGNGSVETTGCDIFVNSCHSVDALMGQGNTYIELSAEGDGTGGKIYVCGEVMEQGPAYFYPEPSEENGEKNNPANEAADPFINVNFPDYSTDPADCTFTNFSSTDSNVVLQAGVYCGGISVTGNGTVTLNPAAGATPAGHPDGVFIIKDGPFSVAGTKTILGENVTIFLTGADANLDFGGTADIHLSAPTTGTYEGFVIFGDRDNPAANPHVARGTPMGGYDGAIYLPETMVLMQGTAGVMAGYSSTCTMVVADKFNFLGTPNFEAQKSGCPPALGGGGGGMSVKLVGQ